MVGMMARSVVESRGGVRSVTTKIFATLNVVVTARAAATVWPWPWAIQKMRKGSSEEAVLALCSFAASRGSDVRRRLTPGSETRTISTARGPLPLPPPPSEKVHTGAGPSVCS